MNNRIRFRLESDLEANTCSHGKQLRTYELVGMCVLCRRYTCKECNVKLPGSSIFGYICKRCAVILSLKLSVLLLFFMMILDVISKL